jgi:bla regulator protein blaR1
MIGELINLTGLLNHLWQSTLCGIVAGLLALAFRRNRAQVRYWLWFSASIKFLIPFALLISLGSYVHWAPARSVAAQSIPAVSVAMEEVGEPFPPTASFVQTAPGAIQWVPLIILSAWACGFAAIAVIRYRGWRRIRGAVGASAPWFDRRAGVVGYAIERVLVRASRALLEPGVVGIFRPVLLLPEGIEERLTPAQLDAVIAHELCHVRRRDNLFASIHMLVEALLWFHPLVWWIGARLLEERERACDEAVLSSGSEPHVYAEAIVNVCKSYVESPLVCVAGVTGSDLKRRIEAIMANRASLTLNLPKKFALAIAGIAALAAPIGIGIMNAPARALAAEQSAAAAPVPKWDVISVKPCDPSTPQGRSGGGAGGGFSPGTLSAPCAIPIRLIEEAYGFFANGRTPTWKSVPIEGAPSWLNSERYTIAAKAESPQSRAMMFGPMMQKLLEDRFKLKIRREIREVPVYNLTIAKGGPRNLKASKPGTCVALDIDNPPPPSGDLCKMFGRRRIAEGEREFQELGVTMAEFSDALAAMSGRNVIDKTGLTGTFDIQAQVSLPDEPPRDPTQPRTGPDDESDLVFAVVQKLGMKLESAKGPGVVYVIESIERPSDNFDPPAAEAPSVAAKPQHTATVAERPLAFDAASIKPDNPSGGRGPEGGPRGSAGLLNFTPGRVAGTGVNAMRLIVDAYHLRDYQLSGGPGWLESERYDFEGKSEGAATDSQLRQMLQTFVTERLGLRMHRETKEMQVYAMTIAKGGFKAPELKSEDDAQPGAFHHEPADEHAKHLVVMNTLDQFAAMISKHSMVDLPVINKTGRPGRYRFLMGWDEDADFLPALQSEFGLKLERQKASVDILVIDHVAKPIGN